MQINKKKRELNDPNDIFRDSIPKGDKNPCNDSQTKYFSYFQFLNGLTIHNEYNPADIVALNRFERVMKMMENFIGGDVEAAFRNFAGETNMMTYSHRQFQEHGSFTLYHEMSSEMRVAIGFWLRRRERMLILT